MLILHVYMQVWCNVTSSTAACRALLNAPMIEGQQGEVDIQDVRKPVFQALLYFTYTDQLPEVHSPC